MKGKLFLLTLLLYTFCTGCFKTSNQAPPINVPSGTFSGQFRLLHKPQNQSSFDTLKTNIILTLKSSDYTYSVTGDTSTLHAGSHGVWGISGSNIIFTDATYPKTGIPPKTHLNGYYLYYYGDTVLRMEATSSDTLALQYDLKKTQ